MSTPKRKPPGKLMAPLDRPVEAVTPEEKRFFKELGSRIAELRKEQNLTQQQLADELGIAQQVIASYEIGRRRVPVSTLPALARALAVPIESLLGEPARAAKRGPAPKLVRHMERITQLPKAKQRFVIEMLETVLAQTSR
ncbi:MAG: helix-turn-helix domain-containing protein [Burkholderiales bacterium]